MKVSMTKDVSSKLPLDDVCYMIRCDVEGDYTWIEDEKYLSQLTIGYRQIVEHLILKGRNKGATRAYIHYFLWSNENFVKVRERISAWVKGFEWEDKTYGARLEKRMMEYTGEWRFHKSYGKNFIDYHKLK